MKETRYVWVKNLPENTQEDKVREYFKSFGGVEKVKLISKRKSEEGCSAIVAFVNIGSAHNAQSGLKIYEDRQLQITYSDPSAMSSVSGRRGDQSPSSHGPSSSYRTHSSHRSEGSRSFDGHSVDRGYSGERHRGYISPVYKSSEYVEGKAGQKHKDSKLRGSTLSSKVDRKAAKMEAARIVKKKNKRPPDEPRLLSKVTKVPRQKDYSSTKRKNSKKKREISSSDEEEEQESSSSSESEDESSQQSSTESSATSGSSSSSNSGSSSSRSSIDSNQGEQKLVTIIIKKLPSRPSANNLREGIYHEFKKCGKVKSVVIRGENNSRNALVLFRNSSEANKAISHAKTKLLFGAALEASLYDGEVSGKELQECGGIIDEFHPRASRTLFVGNLDKTVQYSDIQNIFVRFGDILAIDIKKMYNVPQYAFLQYTDIASVVKAIQKMDGELLGRNVLKLGFGKTVMSSCVWVEGVTDGFTEHYLASCFHKYGSVKRVIIDRTIGQALVFYLKYEHAQKAISNLRGRNMNGSRLKLDYASHELVELFLNRMQRTGQAGPSFESIRSLLLPTPSGPGMPPANPPPGSSRSSRSGSSHAYPGRSDPYYEGMHMSRYHPPPHGYDGGPPPRGGDWRPWDDRSRGRPVYQNVSPRGRRYDDERGEYYRRDAEHFDRIPGRYEQDYRGPDYIRKDDFPPRSYGDDYHRTMKPRDHHEPYHMTPPGRVIHRRSRSISPRFSASSSRARGPEFDPKLDIRSREHRDHSLSRGRSPIKSPGSKDGRLSGPAHKYRDHGPHTSPNVFRRDDERRVELRDPKSLPGSPRSRGKGVGDSPDSRSMGSWSTGHGQPTARHDVEMLAAWDIHNYERSRSETPTRDENTATIGEVIIKQQPSRASSSKPESMKSDGDKQQSDDFTMKKKKSKTSQSDSKGASPERIIQRQFSPPTESHKKKHKVNREVEHKKYKQTDEKSSKKLKASNKDEKRRKETRSDTKSHYSEKPHSKPSALIKREYSPSSLDGGNEQKRYDRRSSKQEPNPDARIHRITDDSSSKSRQNRHSKSSTGDAEAVTSSHKKRKRSQSNGSDSDSPFRKDTEHVEPKLKRSFSDTSDVVKAGKRSRKGSSLHEAPLPVASQIFMSGVEEESAASVDSDAREPSAEFRPKVVVREEVIEMEADTEEEQQESPSTTEEVPREKKKKSRWEPQEEKPVRPGPKVAIAQPFQTTLVTSQLAMAEREKSGSDDDEAEASETPSGESKQKLSHLEEEKKQLEVLLMKLDAKQALAGDEAEQVADVFLAKVADKIKAKHAKKEKKQQTPKSETSSPGPLIPDDAVEQQPEVTEANEISSSVEVPEMIEEQTIVEEEVTSNDEMTLAEAPEMTSPEVLEHIVSPEVYPQTTTDVTAEVSNEKAEPKELMSERQREKYQRSLLRRQRKERERHKRKVDKMRGPSQSIVSSMLDEENSDNESPAEDLTPVDPYSNDEKPKDTEMEVTEDQSLALKDSPVMTEEKQFEASPAVADVEIPEQEIDEAMTQLVRQSPTLMTSSAKDDESSKSETSSKTTPQTDDKARADPTSDTFAVPYSKDSTPGSTPQSAKPDVSPCVQKILLPQDENSRTSKSPFTPKSAAQAEKTSQSSGRSSTSLTPLTPSPKIKPQQSNKATTSTYSVNSKQADERRKKQEHSKPAQKQEGRYWKAKPSNPRYYTNLTVSREADSSKPLGKKELERLRLEVAKVKKELDRDMSQEFLSPASEGDPQIPPMSPILKSPSIDLVAPDFYSRSGTSPIVGTSPSTLPGSNSSSLTERMKLLGKVKKKMRSEEEAANGKLPQQRPTDKQGNKEFGNSRFLKSSIFDQDSLRLSHLQNLPQQEAAFKTQPASFSTFDSGELPEDKPLFSDIVSKSDKFETNSVKALPKNECPLSSNITLPAAAERTILDEAGKPPGSLMAAHTSTSEDITLGADIDKRTAMQETLPESQPLIATQVFSVNVGSQQESLIETAFESQTINPKKPAGQVEVKGPSPPEASISSEQTVLPTPIAYSEKHIDEVSSSGNTEEADQNLISIQKQEAEVSDISDVETTSFAQEKADAAIVARIKPEAVEVTGEVEIFSAEPDSLPSNEVAMEVEEQELKKEERRAEKMTNKIVDSEASTMDISKSTALSLDDTPVDDVSTRDIYMGDITDVITTEVVSSDAIAAEVMTSTSNYVSQPGISDDFSAQEVIEDGAASEEPALVIETGGKVLDAKTEKESVPSDADVSITVQESDASLKLSQKQISPSVKSPLSLPSSIKDESKPFTDAIKVTNVTQQESDKKTEISSKTTVSKSETPIKSASKKSSKTPSDSSKTPSDSSKTPSDSPLEKSKKSENLLSGREVSKTTSKLSSDAKEKKMSSDKKSKLEKLKKEKKASSSKELASSSEKVLSKTTHLSNLSGIEKGQDKPVKKIMKDDKQKSVLGSAGKQKLLDSKLAKSTEANPAGSSKHDVVSEDEKQRKKLQKLSRKPLEPPQKPAASGSAKAFSHQESQKSSKSSDKVKSSSEVEKKLKHHKHEGEKKREHKQKHSKDDKSWSHKEEKSSSRKDEKLSSHKDEKSSKEEKSSSHKKIKEDVPSEKQKLSQSTHKKQPIAKEVKKEKTKIKESSQKDHSVVSKPEKTKLKAKHSKAHAEPTHEPAKKKVKLSPSPSAPKQKHPTISSFDSDMMEVEEMAHKKASSIFDSKPKIKTQTALSESSKKSEKPLPSKPKQKSEQKSSLISSDSESSGNFDNFISLISGGSSKSSFQQKSSSKAIYSSSDSSDLSDHEVESKSKLKSQKSSRSERYDSDKSDHSMKKQPSQPKASSDATKTKPKSKKTKQAGDKSHPNIEKSSKKQEKTSSKILKPSGKEKKSKPSAHDSDSELLPFRLKTDLKRKKHHLKSESDTSSSDEERTVSRRKSFAQVKKKPAKMKKSSDASALGDGHGFSKFKKGKPSSSSAKKEDRSARKLSSSSSEFSDYAPPPAPQSSLLTVETIKDETVIPSSYMLNALEPSGWSQKPSRADAQAIYSASGSSSSELEDATFREMTTEDRKKFFGSSASSSDSDFDFGSSHNTVVEQKRRGLDERKEKDKKVKKEATEFSKGRNVSSELKLSADKVSKPSKIHEQKKDSIRQSSLTEKKDSFKEKKDSFTEKKESFKEKKDSFTEKKESFKEKKDSFTEKKDSFKEKKDSKLKHQDVEKTKQPHEQKLKSAKKEEKLALPAESKPKEKSDHSLSKPKSQEQKVLKKMKPSDDKHRKYDDKHKKEPEAPKQDKHKKEKSKVILGEKPKEKPLKLDSSKSHSFGKSAHKEKKPKDQSATGVEKTDEKFKPQKDTTISKTIKLKPKDHSNTTQQKERLEKKDSKPLKERGHEQTKMKKEKGPGHHDKATAQVVLQKADKKKSTKPDKFKTASSPDILSQGVVLPSLKIDDEPKMDDDAPGRSFFCGDMFDKDDKLSKEDIVSEPKSTCYTSASPQEPGTQHKLSVILPSDNSGQPQKSLFSPTKEDEADSCSSFEETIAKFSQTKYSSPTRRSSHGSLLPMTSPNKSRLDVDAANDEKNKKQRKSSESPRRVKRLSSYEQYKLEQERRREHMKELKKLSQQRDEEAVRSIMAGDNASEALSGDNLEYFPISGQEGSAGESSVTGELGSVFDEPAESVTESISQQTDSMSESDTKQVKNPTPEPRSTAEEDELAAALRSIEGFGDFNLAAKEDPPAPTSYQSKSFPPNVDLEEKSPPTDSPASTDHEAEEAASALLQETTSQYKSKRDEASTKHDYETTLILPSVRSDEEPLSKPLLTKLGQKTPEKEKKGLTDAAKPTKKSEFPSKPPTVKSSTTENQPTQARSSNRGLDSISKPFQTLPEKETPVTSMTLAASPNTKQERAAPPAKPASSKPTDHPPSTLGPTKTEATARPFVSLAPSRDPPSGPEGPGSAELKPNVVEAPRPEPTQPQVVSRRPSADNSLYQTVPQSSSYPHQQLSMHKTIAPMHEAAFTLRPPQPSPPASTPKTFHAPPVSAPHMDQSAISARQPVPQERPQIQTPPHAIHRPHQPMLPQQIASPHNVRPQAALKRTDSAGQLRPPHVPVSAALSTPMHHPVAKTNTPQQPAQTPIMRHPVAKPSVSLEQASNAPMPHQVAKPNMPIQQVSGAPVHHPVVKTSMPQQHASSTPMHHPVAKQNVPQQPALSAPMHHPVVTKTSMPQQQVASTPMHHPGTETSMPQQQFQPSQKERVEKAAQNVPPGPHPFHPPSSNTPSSLEQHQELARNVPISQAVAKPPQLIPQFAPRQFFSPSNLSMYAMHHNVPGGPFGRPPYTGFNVPLQISQGMSPQQQPHTSTPHLFPPRTPAHFMDLPKEMLASHGVPAQAQNAERQRQISPGRGLLAHTAGPRAQDFQNKMHAATPPRPHMLEHQSKAQEMRPSFPGPMDGSGRHSISMMGGDSMTMVDKHFQMSGVSMPPTSSHPNPHTSSVTSMPASAPGALHPANIGSLPQRPAHQDPSSRLMAPHPQLSRFPASHLFHEAYRQPLSSQAPRERLFHPRQMQPGPSFEPSPSNVIDSQQRRQEGSGRRISRPEDSQPDNLQDLFQRYPVIWQGKLALKNDSAAVQIHFVAGNMKLGQASLPKQPESHDGTGLAELRIVQRMRTNAEQMNSLRDRMTRDEECCFLLALPCGRDQNDIVHQTKALCTGFIEYLQQKEVAGIVNVEGMYGPSQAQLALVLHVFPPSEFTSTNLQYRAPDLLSNVADIKHLMIVVTPA